MDIFVYSDESGVFDYLHNRYYVYGGLILLGKDEKDALERKYIVAESSISGYYESGIELKASAIKPKHRATLFRSANQYYKFGVIIDQNKVIKRIFDNKKSKQRYLDFAYKMGVKNAFVKLLELGAINKGDVENIHFFVDEHTTATDGRYELREGLLQEFKEGTFNVNYQLFFEPIFPDLKGLDLVYCNSAKKALVRTSDVIANRIYHEIMSGNDPCIRNNLFIKYLP